MTFTRSRYALPLAFGLVAAGLILLGLAEPAGATSVAVLLTAGYLFGWHDGEQIR